MARAPLFAENQLSSGRFEPFPAPKGSCQMLKPQMGLMAFTLGTIFVSGNGCSSSVNALYREGASGKTTARLARDGPAIAEFGAY